MNPSNDALRGPAWPMGTQLPRKTEPDHLELAPSAIELISLFLVTMVGLMLWWGGAYLLATTVMAAGLCLIPGVNAYLLLRRRRAAIFSPLFGFRICTSVLLGFGALFHMVAPIEVIMYSSIHYATPDEELAKLTFLWSASVFLVLFSARIAAQVIDATPRPSDAPALPLKTFGYLFLCVGLTMTLGIKLPINANLIDLTIPGAIDAVFMAFQGVGLYLLARHYFSIGNPGGYAIIFGLLLAFLFLSLLMVQKETFIIAAFLVAIGYLNVKVTVRRLLLVIIPLSVSFWWMQSAVNYARVHQNIRSGEFRESKLSERLVDIESFVGGDRIGTADTKFEALNRLDYVMPASFAIMLYDTGRRSDELANSAFAFIPRAIWPEKPELTTAAQRIWYLMGQQSQNSVGITIFADLYWNFGWLGLLACLLIGPYFWACTQISEYNVRQNDFLMMPFNLYVLMISLTIDRTFLAATMMPMALSVVLYFFLRAMRRFMLEGPLKSLATEPVARLQRL